MGDLILTPVAAAGGATGGENGTAGFVRVGAGLSASVKIGKKFQPFFHLVPQYNQLIGGRREDSRRAGAIASVGGFAFHPALHVEAGYVPQYNFSQGEMELGGRLSVNTLLPTPRTFGLGLFCEMPDLLDGLKDGAAAGLQITGLIDL